MFTSFFELNRVKSWLLVWFVCILCLFFFSFSPLEVFDQFLSISMWATLTLRINVCWECSVTKLVIYWDARWLWHVHYILVLLDSRSVWAVVCIFVLFTASNTNKDELVILTVWVTIWSEQCALHTTSKVSGYTFGIRNTIITVD